MAQINISWTDMYKEFGEKLLLYKDDRKTLITKIKKVFEDIKIKLPKLENNNAIVDIDPFTVFALFNKQIKEENRKAILRGIKDEFGLTSDVPTGFDALPTLMPLNSTFYWFEGGRGKDDIQNIWDLFVAANDLTNSETDENKQKFCDAFDKTKDQIGISWRITSGLFWVFPYRYFSMDSRNRWFVGEYNNVFSTELKNTIRYLSEVPSGEQYLDICKRIKDEFPNTPYANYIELSSASFVESEKVNKENKEKAKNEEIETEDSGPRYWLYSPGENASHWDECTRDGVMLLGWGELGDLNAFGDKNSIKEKMRELYGTDKSYKNDAHATWQFSKEIKPGDIIIVKKGMLKVIGRGVVESDYSYDGSRQDTFNHVRKVKWTNIGIWDHPGKAAMKALTDITQYTEYVQNLESLFVDEESDEDVTDTATKYKKYTKEDFLKTVFMDNAEYERLVGLLMHEKNIILQGAPGVGKTFIARKLAYSIMEEANTDRVEIVQFHQSYSYEDFVIGYRPGENQPFELSTGIFYNFCKKAEEDDEKTPYFFIIDEINRGNLSKIFGELFMLVEKDKRGIEIPLLYGKRKFKIPKNVYIIGTMNTADRSLAIIDYALRRRFAFYNVAPKFDDEKFNEYACGFENEKFINLINTVKALNAAISKDDTLGEGFCIGHSYFSELESVDDITLYNIVEYKLIQLLKEYWFDEPSKVATWSDALRKAIK